MMKNSLTTLAAALIAMTTQQGCGIMGSMLFDPDVRVAFQIPKDTTPISVIEEDPKAFNGKVVAVEGIVTASAEDFFILDSYLHIDRQNPQFESVALGDTVKARGKFVSASWHRQRPDLKYARCNDMSGYDSAMVTPD